MSGRNGSSVEEPKKRIKFTSGMKKFEEKIWLAAL